MKQISLRLHIIAVCVVVACVLLFRIDRADVVGDSATYLYRSVGMIDFMSSKLQTTPLQWFKDVPWWLRLQFHDAPPVAFWIMHGALAISGNAVVAARAVAALMLTVFAVLHWVWVTRNSNARRAWVWIAIFAGYTSLLALGRTNLLESYQLLWLGAGLLAFSYTEHRPRAWYFVAMCFGVAILTKYTAVFVLAGPLFWLALNPAVMRQRVVQKAGLIFSAFLIIPLVYNFFMLLTVGHADLQVSQALGINTSAHWSAVARAFAPLSGENIRAATHLFFPSVWVLVIVTIIFVARRAIQKTDRIVVALGVGFIATIIQMMALGADERFSAGFLVVCATAVAYVCTHMKITGQPRQPRQPSVRYGIVAVIALCIIGGWVATARNLYAFNEPHGAWRIVGRETNGGFNGLDTIISNYLDGKQPQATADMWGFHNSKFALYNEYKRVAQKPTRATQAYRQPYRGAIIYDARMSWFSSLWYFERWNLYRGFTLLSTADFGAAEQREQNYFGSRGFDPDEYSFILSLHPPTDAPPALRDLAEQTVAFFEGRHAMARVVRGPDGTVRFKIFGPLAQTTLP